MTHVFLVSNGFFNTDKFPWKTFTEEDLNSEWIDFILIGVGQDGGCPWNDTNWAAYHQWPLYWLGCSEYFRFHMENTSPYYSHKQLTHWDRDKMATISLTIFSSVFSWMKIFKFRLKCHWSLFPRAQFTICHYLNQWWLDYRRIYAWLGLNELKH